MKKKTIKSFDSLELDVLDYMFVEFLIRHSVYSRFIENFARFHADGKAPRSAIRDLILLTLYFPPYSPVDLISISFPFCCTPEGSRFWSRLSGEWSSFLKFFSKTI